MVEPLFPISIELLGDRMLRVIRKGNVREGNSTRKDQCKIKDNYSHAPGVAHCTEAGRSGDE